MSVPFCILEFSGHGYKPFVSNGRHAPELASSAFEQAADLSGRPLTAASSRNVPRIERERNRPKRRKAHNLQASKTGRLGSSYRSGRADCCLKIKNPAAPAVKREAEEDWTYKWRSQKS